MSLNKAITHGKEKRKPYRGSKRFDKSCRNHGGCPHCEPGRQHASKRTDPLGAPDTGAEPEETPSCQSGEGEGMMDGPEGTGN
jgi:hypothetical protein